MPSRPRSPLMQECLPTRTQMEGSALTSAARRRNPPPRRARFTIGIAFVESLENHFACRAVSRRPSPPPLRRLPLCMIAHAPAASPGAADGPRASTLAHIFEMKDYSKQKNKKMPTLPSRRRWRCRTPGRSAISSQLVFMTKQTGGRGHGPGRGARLATAAIFLFSMRWISTCR